MSRPFASSPFARTILNDRYAWPKFALGQQHGFESWPEVAQRVVDEVTAVVAFPKDARDELLHLFSEGVFITGGRYLYAAGREYHQTNNCLMLRAEDTREGWGDLLGKATMALMSGAGIGVVYSGIRPGGLLLKRTGGFSSGPLALMHAVNEVGRAAKQGGNRRAAIWAGLLWSHGDIMDFIRHKDWSADVHAMKAKDQNYPAPLDHTNISVILDDQFFEAIYDDFHLMHGRAVEVYRATVAMACRTGDPGFSVNVGDDAGEDLRNACTELTSRDDSDVCNLGSINLARVTSLGQMKAATELGSMLLLAGTVYSDVPYDKVVEVRERNRRLGLGIMGAHEFQMVRGERYGTGTALKPYLQEYAWSSNYAVSWADKWGLSRPVKTRAIAPTGTIGIIAETTTGIEPMFCAAYRRRYYARGAVPVMKAQYVVDPLARKMVEEYGVLPSDIEDAMTLAADPVRRVKFQVMVQQYVDHGISSTINLPAWGSATNNEDTLEAFGDMLLPELPKIRGITVYPDAARGGQPLERCDYNEALEREGDVITEQVDVCDIRGASCGS